ncbi:MAG: TetR/AcrR family transcriptional regulator [Phycisphaerae bacterium]
MTTTTPTTPCPPTRKLSAAELFGVRSVAKNARDRLLDTAIDLFYAHGFHAVGLDRVLAETGVTKTTFYKHFESKDDLVVAAIERRDEWERGAWGRAIGKLAGDDPRARLVALFDVLDVWFNDPSFGGCIFINAAAEFADPRDPAHQVAAAHKRRARDDFRDLARAAGATDPEALADQYTALFEGTLIMRHVHGRDDAARVIKPVIERLIEAFIPARV